MNDVDPQERARRIELGRWRRNLVTQRAVLLGAQSMGEDVTEQWQAYREELDRYNTAVQEHNAPIRAERLRARVRRERAAVVRQNAAAAAKIRARRCDRCFTVRSASGVCLCD